MELVRCFATSQKTMRDFLEEKPLLCIETMHGFDQGVAELAPVGVKIIYAPLPTLLKECLRHNTVVGIIKGPRTKIRRRELDLLAHKHPNLVISYIGRHPSQALAPEIQVVATAREETTLAVQTSYGAISVTSLAHSPLSSAVCAYVVTLSHNLLVHHDEQSWQLSINAGNTFSCRRGHSFTMDSLKGKLFGCRDHVAVIGAGDIGSQVIQSCVQGGAQVRYTTKHVQVKAAEGGCFVPSLSSLLGSWSKIDVLTIHVPPGTVIPLEQVQHVGIFINTSSGSCIDDDELIRALAEERIHCALIDVFRQEGDDFHGRVDLRTGKLVQSRLNPFPHTLDTARDTERKRLLQRLIDERRLFLTPHIAYLEENAVRQTLSAAIENIVRCQNISLPLAAC